MTAIDDLKAALGGDLNQVSLSAVKELKEALLILELTAKGEEPCSLAKDKGHPGDNWV